MSRQILIGMVLVFGLSLAWAGGDKPKSTFRIHVQTSGDGLSKNQAQTIYLSDPPEPVQVSTLPEVSERDLVKVEARNTPQGRALWVKFNGHGTIVLNASTTASMGRIMVVYLNQRVIFAPVIDQRIGSGELLVPYAVTDEEIKALQETIKKNDK